MERCQSCGAGAERHPVRVRWSVRVALLGITFAVAYFGAAPRLTGMLEGVRGGWVPAAPALLVTAGAGLLAFLAGFARPRRPVCLGCGSTAPAWLFAPRRAAAAQPTAPSAVRPSADAPRELARDATAAPAAEAEVRAEPTGDRSRGAFDPHTGRRSFLATAGAVGASGIATAAAGLGGILVRHAPWRPVARDIHFAEVQRTSLEQHPQWAGSRVRAYRRLGRTGFEVSDISLGSAAIDDQRVALLALERGVNYFDTAPDYSRNGSELVLGRAIHEFGRRDRVFLASKFCTAEGHLPPEAPVAEIMGAVESSLRRLQTDYLDLVHIHSCDRTERLLAPTFHEAFDRLREQGKARFLGVSTHTPELETVARAALDSGRFDVLMLAYHHGVFPGIGQVIDEAHARDVGVVAMKTLKGAKAAQLPGLSDRATAYSQAAFRWVLANPSVSCLVISFSKPEHCDEYLYASGSGPEPADAALLDRYDRLASADYCRPHCGACLASCPVGLPIDTVLRYDMYFADYGREAIARDKYARLGRLGLDAAACAGCPAPCAGACPFELPIRAKMVRAHERLSRA